MDQIEYKLKSEIFAHTNDVRTICFMDNAIISGSRDMTVKLWTENGGDYEIAATLKAHTKYISSVCVLSFSENFPMGLILTGGHDHKIFGFLPYTDDPILCLEGHSGPVCCLSDCVKKDLLLSSSWDCSAKLWDVFRQHCLFTIYGHTQTIWAVIHVPYEFIVTGSADKTIKVFGMEGNYMNTLSGHTDCVRGLSYLHGTFVVSCGNDGTVRTWNVKDGSCLNVHQLTSNYIYSIKAVHERNLIVAGCEDKILSVLHKGRQQDIKLPAQSVWAVGILPNSDIVAGSSDGYIRIYTMSPSEGLEVLEKQLIDASMSDHDVFRKISRNNLDEGEFDGQLKFIKVLDRIKCFKWFSSNKQWLPLELLKNADQELNSEMEIDNGKEYDHVYIIEVDGNNNSPLKLKFDNGDDPLLVAEGFVCFYNLNPKFTKVIFDFIKQKSSDQEVQYINRKNSADKDFQPFYPPDKFIFFQRFEEKILKQRLEDFWRKQNSSFDELAFNNLTSLVLPNDALQDNDINCGIREMIKCLDTWTESQVFPVLDIARISLLRTKISYTIFREDFASKLWILVEKYMHENSSFNNKMLVCRLICNMFSTDDGINFIFARKESLFSKLPMSSFTEKHRGFEIALSSLLVNISMEAVKRRDTIASSVCLEILQRLLYLVKDEEAIFRLLVALGTLSSFFKQLVFSKDVYKFLKNVINRKIKEEDASIKVVECSNQLLVQYVDLILKSDSDEQKMENLE